MYNYELIMQIISYLIGNLLRVAFPHFYSYSGKYFI